MKSIVQIKDLTLICDEVYGNGIAATLGLTYVKKMPQNRGLIFYLAEGVDRMTTAKMQFDIDICPIKNGMINDVVEGTRCVIEMNYGLLKKHGIRHGDKITVTRVLDGCEDDALRDLA